jgi:hypothetical protein
VPCFFFHIFRKHRNTISTTDFICNHVWTSIFVVNSHYFTTSLYSVGFNSTCAFTIDHFFAYITHQNYLLCDFKILTMTFFEKKTKSGEPLMFVLLS